LDERKKSFINIVAKDINMKHTVQITLLLVLIFLASQLIGLVTLNNYYGHDSQGNVEYKDLPMSLERPEVEDKTSGFFIFFAVIIGTLLLLLLVKLKSRYITKGWFFLAMFLALLLAFNGYIDEKIALTLALVFAIWKVFFPNPYIHNLTEIFIYGGIAVLSATGILIYRNRQASFLNRKLKQEVLEREDTEKQLQKRLIIEKVVNFIKF